MKIGSKVKLNTFIGKNLSDENTNDHEDYWKLIGCEGIIASEKLTDGYYRPDLGPQVLVDFGEQLSLLGLENHNPEGSGIIRIFVSDLISE